MKCLRPNYREQRGARVLLVWGDLPFWLIVDEQAARFIDLLLSGQPLGAALEASGGTQREAAAVLARLRQAGVVGARLPRVAGERIESSPSTSPTAATCAAPSATTLAEPPPRRSARTR